METVLKKQHEKFAEFGEIISKNKSPLSMIVYIDIRNYQNLTDNQFSYISMDTLHLDDFFSEGFITPLWTGIPFGVTRNSFYPFKITHSSTKLKIEAIPIQINQQDIDMLNTGNKFYVKPYFSVSQKYKAWSLETIMFDFDKRVSV